MTRIRKKAALSSPVLAGRTVDELVEITKRKLEGRAKKADPDIALELARVNLRAKARDFGRIAEDRSNYDVEPGPLEEAAAAALEDAARAFVLLSTTMRSGGK